MSQFKKIFLMKKVLILLGIVSFCLNVSAQLKASTDTVLASFTIDKESNLNACKSINATFKNNSICTRANNRGCKYVWNWGDGTKNDTVIKKDNDPVKHTYTKDGKFTVRLTMLDSATKKPLSTTKSMATRTDYIKVYNPSAKFSYKEDTVSFQYVFDATDYKPFHAEAWRYEWDFGDKTDILSDTVNKTRHQYKEENFSKGYVVSLKVTIDSSIFDFSKMPLLNGCAAVDTTTVEVTDAFFTDDTKKNIPTNRKPKLPNIITPDSKYGEFSLDSTDANPELKSNDIWYFKSNGQDVFTIHVYNRWGSLVFEKTSKVIYWDGVDMSEDPVQSGVYFYTIESDKGDKRHNTAGYIHVFRED